MRAVPCSSSRLKARCVAVNECFMRVAAAGDGCIKQVISLLRRFLFLPHLAIGRSMMRARETVFVLEKSTQNSQHCRYHYIIDNWSPLQVQEPLNVCYSIGLSNQAQLIYNNPSQTQISDVCSLNAVLCECVYPLHISLMTPHDPHLRQVMAPCRTASRLAAVLTRAAVLPGTSQAMHA